jgi:hypothetical protein
MIWPRLFGWVGREGAGYIASACTLGPRLYRWLERDPTVFPLVDNNNSGLHRAPMSPQLVRGMSSSLLFGDRSLGEVLMRPLLPEAGGTIAVVERSEPIRDRAKARGLGASCVSTI